ncbi:MAG TPA: L,D-transpeptidase [Rhizobiaceae bacterium]|nr:L,D-transpeptidase [Rhizobiaceae bacterium]
MIRKAFIAGALAVGAFVFASAPLATSARAELVYNASEGRWEEVNLAQRQRMKAVPSKFKRRGVMVATQEAPGTIIIDTNNKFLYHITGNNRATRYGVGVGREGFGWSGTVKVGAKKEWPTWTPPAEMRARERAAGRILPISMAGGPDNPLGARAMYLYKGGRDTIYRIHGTNQPWSIGLNLSSGCIRMMNKDVEHLYSNVDIGTKVIVVGPGEDARKYVKEGLGGAFGGALTSILGG